MKKNFTDNFIFALIALAVFSYVCFGHKNSIGFSLLFSFLSGAVIFRSVKKSYEVSSLITFFNIANLFAAFIFIVRPIYFLIQDEFLSYPARIYYNVTGFYLGYADLPWAKASLIGMLGIAFLNIPLLYTKKRLDLKILSAQKSSYKFTKKQLLMLSLFTVMAFALGLVFVLKKNIGISVHIYDLVWIFLFSSMLLYIISRKRRANIFLYFIIACAILFLSLSGRRQYIVNLLLCYIIPIYFVGKNRKKTYALLALFVLLTFVVVRVYAGIRGSTQSNLFYGVISEFSMYDMLMVTDFHFDLNNIGLFWGYNYLDIFTIPIPKLHVRPFDHMATGIVFNGFFHGAIPTSIFGSLYFNFSYIGVCLGSFILGSVLLKAQKFLSSDISYESIGYYSIFATFVYDIIRVGDIGREFWSCMTLIIVYSFFMFFMRKIRNDTIVLKSAS